MSSVYFDRDSNDERARRGKIISRSLERGELHTHVPIYVIYHVGGISLSRRVIKFSSKAELLYYRSQPIVGIGEWE